MTRILLPKVSFVLSVLVIGCTATTGSEVDESREALTADVSPDAQFLAMPEIGDWVSPADVASVQVGDLTLQVHFEELGPDAFVGIVELTDAAYSLLLAPGSSPKLVVQTAPGKTEVLAELVLRSPDIAAEPETGIGSTVQAADNCPQYDMRYLNFSFWAGWGPTYYYGYLCYYQYTWTQRYYPYNTYYRYRCTRCIR